MGRSRRFDVFHLWNGYYGQLVNIARNVDNTAPSVDIGGQHDVVGRIGGELCA